MQDLTLIFLQMAPVRTLRRASLSERTTGVSSSSARKTVIRSEQNPGAAKNRPIRSLWRRRAIEYRHHDDRTRMQRRLTDHTSNHSNARHCHCR